MTIIKLSDEWQTPQVLFDELNTEFSFDIDLCATYYNAKLENFYTDYLNNIMGSKRSKDLEFTLKLNAGVHFMNPPYSNPRPFIEKAWEDSKYCKIICLVPSAIKTCKYMDILDSDNGLATFRNWRIGLEIRDMARRTGFVHPEKISSSPSFGCMLLIMDRRG